MLRSFHPVMLLNLVSIHVALGAVLIPKSAGVEQRPSGKWRQTLLKVAEVTPGPGPLPAGHAGSLKRQFAS